ncbi:MAG: hypothetical protein L0287_02965 [Anaerolineae bacterium]|nr:hypothetical protein [Anaerolineae bacterium]
MTNLKTYYDAALAADAEVKRIMNEMDALFNDGTEDGKKKALELRPALDEAKLKAEQANQLYVSMRDASLVNDNAAALFTSPVDPAAQSDQEENSKVINRAGFKALTPAARLSFIKAGGTVVD